MSSRPSPTPTPPSSPTSPSSRRSPTPSALSGERPGSTGLRAHARAVVLADARPTRHPQSRGRRGAEGRRAPRGRQPPGYAVVAHPRLSRDKKESPGLSTRGFPIPPLALSTALGPPTEQARLSQVTAVVARRGGRRSHDEGGDNQKNSGVTVDGQHDDAGHREDDDSRPQHDGDQGLSPRAAAQSLAACSRFALLLAFETRTGKASACRSVTSSEPRLERIGVPMLKPYARRPPFGDIVFPMRN